MLFGGISVEMSATLQNVERGQFIAASDPSAGSKSIACLHRRTQTILSTYTVPGTEFEPARAYYESNVKDSLGAWRVSKIAWSTRLDTVRIVNVMTIETLECFLALTVNLKTNRVVLVFLDLSCNEVNRYDITENQSTYFENANCTNVACADLDQNRKEVIICLRGGRIQAFAIRFVKGNKHVKDHYVAVFRFQGRLSADAKKGARQVVISDISEVHLVLSKGGISAFATGTLDQLWFIDRSFFRYEPYQIWCDKFGANFVVHCQDSTGTKDVLEYWAPPNKFALCEAGQFDRCVLPLKGQLALLTIESLTSATGTFVIYMTTEGRMQLWRPVRTRGGEDLSLDSEVRIAIPPLPIQATELAVEEGKGELKGKGKEKGKSAPTSSSSSSGNKGRVGFATFVQNHLPDCPISLVTVYGTDVYSLVIHAPSDTDTPQVRGGGGAMNGGYDNDGYYGDEGYYDEDYGYGYKNYPPETAEGFFDKKREEDEEARAVRKEQQAQQAQRKMHEMHEMQKGNNVLMIVPPFDSNNNERKLDNMDTDDHVELESRTHSQTSHTDFHTGHTGTVSQTGTEQDREFSGALSDHLLSRSMDSMDGRVPVDSYHNRLSNLSNLSKPSTANDRYVHV